ncbi:MAG: hypothetical protein ABIQ64_04395, partial [Candidatus Saccharimonadales bacterium]
MTRQHLIITLIAIFTLIVFVFVAELVYVKYNGTFVPAPTISREYPTMGSGKPIKYIVMGDSTSISQGSEYKDGYAVASAQHLAQIYTVSMLNVGVSGATAKTVRDDQLP